MMRWLPMMATMAWGLSPGPWLEGPGPGEVTYYYNRSFHTWQQNICICTRKFNNGGVAGHSTREGHHLDGPWGAKGRHHHDSKRLEHSPGDIKWLFKTTQVFQPTCYIHGSWRTWLFKTNFQVSFLFTATATIGCLAGHTATIYLDTSTSSQITMGHLGFGPIFIMIENSFKMLTRVTPSVVSQVSE